jgi:hypothetical protein
MTPRRQRTAARWAHIALGAVLNTYLYVTYFRPGSLGWLHTALVWAVIPAVVLLGVFLWQQGRLARLLRRGAAGRPS